MPALLAALLGGLISIAGTVAGRVMLSLGFSLVVYGGLSTSLAWLKSQALTSFSGLPVQAIQMMATMKVGECISIVFSAILARQVLNGLSGDSIKRLVQR